MHSVTTERFRKAYNSLPFSIKEKARNSYKLWRSDPFHPSLSFKQINDNSIFSIRIGLRYRAIAVKENNTMVWFWIGSHEEYNNLV